MASQAYSRVPSKWDSRLHIRWFDWWMFRRLTPELEKQLRSNQGSWLERKLYRRLTYQKQRPRRREREWRGLTTELQAADDAMHKSYSWMLILTLVLFGIALVAIKNGW